MVRHPRLTAVKRRSKLTSTQSKSAALHVHARRRHPPPNRTVYADGAPIARPPTRTTSSDLNLSQPTQNPFIPSRNKDPRHASRGCKAINILECDPSTVAVFATTCVIRCRIFTIVPAGTDTSNSIISVQSIRVSKTPKPAPSARTGNGCSSLSTLSVGTPRTIRTARAPRSAERPAAISTGTSGAIAGIPETTTSASPAVAANRTTT